MPILITAFGPFEGRQENASSLALLEIRNSFPGIRSRILPVDSVEAPSRLKQAILHIQPSALIMLGEAAGIREVRFETTAWNEKTFGIPDIKGRAPNRIPIRNGAAPFLKSTLPLTRIHEDLETRGHSFCFSDDPGRYLCNQLFFTALDFLEVKSMSIPAGFIHLPLAQDLPISESSRTIVKTIRLIQSVRKA